MRAEQRRSRLPDTSGIVVRAGVSLHYDIYGDGPVTVVLLPTWSIVDSRMWKAQVPFLSRYFRVITFDGRVRGVLHDHRGTAAFLDTEFAADTVAVLDATSTDRAVLVGFSCGATWAVHVAAGHPDRVQGIFAIGPSCGSRSPTPNASCGAGCPSRNARAVGRNTPATTGSMATSMIIANSFSNSCIPTRIPPSNSKTPCNGRPKRMLKR